MLTHQHTNLRGISAAVALLNLPIRLELVGTTVVIHGPRDLNTPAEVRVVHLVEQFTDDFRWAGDDPTGYDQKEATTNAQL